MELFELSGEIDELIEGALEWIDDEHERKRALAGFCTDGGIVGENALEIARAYGWHFEVTTTHEGGITSRTVREAAPSEA